MPSEKRGSRRISAFRISACIATLGALAWPSCQKEEPPPAPVIRPVRTVKVQLGGMDRAWKFSGSSRAGMSSKLSFRVAGTIEAIDVEVGDKVKKDHVLARLDARDYDLQVQQARAALAQSEAQLRNADASYKRVRSLYENRSASKSDLDAARAAYESASAGVGAVRKQLALARSQFDYTKLKAPTDGAIAAVNAEVSENVRPGQVVVVLSAGEAIEVEVGVPETLINRVKEGGAVKVRFDSVKEKTFEAAVTEVGVTPVGASSTFPVTVRLLEKDPALRPGMAAEVEFTFAASAPQGATIIPGAAVAEDRQGRHVFVIEGAKEGFGTVRRREVKVGELRAEGIEVLEGLQDGEFVVTAGVSKIQDGLKVRVPQEVEAP